MSYVPPSTDEMGQIVPLRDCVVCHRHIYPGAELAKMTPEQRIRLRATRAGTDGRCDGCSRNTGANDPEPGFDDYADPECSICGYPMPTRRQWRQASEDEREDLILDGYVVPDMDRDDMCRFDARAAQAQNAA